jgi:hypoxanthine phosphoribosyltransferase
LKIASDVKDRIRVLYDADTLARRNGEIAREIVSKDLVNPLVVAVLKGSFMFAADLLRALHAEGMLVEVEFITLSSYKKSTVSSGQVTVVRDVESDVQGRDVILVDDILESGRTLAYARDLLAARGARRVFTVCLLEKPGKRAVDVDADLVGFTIPDLFVIGYGMDLAHSFRELPYIGVIED